jgi:AcrR family transcriptional regulator
MARDETAPSTQAAPVELTTVNGLGRERVSEIQRMRMLVAMAEVACEYGSRDVSVAHVVERAGVSRRTFYELFEDREDCFLAALEEAVARATRYVAAVYDPAHEWTARLRCGLESLLAFVEQEPAFGHLAVVESLAGGARSLDLRLRAIDRLAVAVDAGREGMNGSSSATELTAEGVVGGVVSVIHGRLVAGERTPLVELTNSLMSMIVLPYRGPVAARKELERAAAKTTMRVPSSQSNPLKHLDMRLTYRTVRALAAVAANPGASNRLIGDLSGIGDQGQVSKLLARLEKLGLVQNRRSDASKGATNAWGLTERGEEVASVVKAQAVAS